MTPEQRVKLIQDRMLEIGKPKNHFAAPGSAWHAWGIKVCYSHGSLKDIIQTVKARTKQEAERKAFKVVDGKCLGFQVYPLNDQAEPVAA